MVNASSEVSQGHKSQTKDVSLSALICLQLDLIRAQGLRLHNDTDSQHADRAERFGNTMAFSLRERKGNSSRPQMSAQVTFGGNR